MRLHRVNGVISVDLMQKKHIVIFGAGSVGGFCAHNLAHLVGKLTLVDDERLEESNIERHRAGRKHIGRYKVEALKEVLTNHYGLESDVIHALQMKGQEALPQLENVDLVIDATANTRFQYQLNLWSQECETPVIYVGVYNKGSGWQTITLPNPREVCFMCLELRSIMPDPPAETDGNYGAPTALSLTKVAHGELHAADGLVSAIMATASSAAQQAIDVLHGKVKDATLYRTTYQPRDFMILQSEDQIARVQLAIKLLQPLGIEPFGLRADSEGFTLKLKAGSIPLNIRRADGCLFHDAPLQGAQGG